MRSNDRRTTTFATSFRTGMQGRRAALGFAALTTAAGLLLGGCFDTKGGIMPHTGGGFTYESTSSMPMTIEVVNSCERSATHPNGTPFFIMEIPPGKQLTFNFEEDGGDDPVKRPSRMMYSVWAAHTYTGSLENVLSCPGAACRKIVVKFRPAPEEARPDESYRLQVGEPGATPQAQPRAPRSDRQSSDT